MVVVVAAEGREGRTLTGPGQKGGEAVDVYVQRNADTSIETDYAARMGGYLWPCTLGKNGVVASDEKEEGDGKTPVGAWPLRSILYRADRIPPGERAFLPSGLPARPLCPRDGWCDDPRSPDYNRPVVRPYPCSHEELWRGEGVYDLIGVLGYNDDPVEKGKGSAIFLHVARAGYGATEGCVALALPDLEKLLAAVTRKSHIIVGGCKEVSRRP